MRTYYLYGLRDLAVSKYPKYIGITNNPKERLRKHLLDKADTPKTEWIRKTKELGHKINMVILKKTSKVQEVIEWEIKAIAKYKDIWNLTNYTSGGEYYGIGKPIDVYDLKYNYIESCNSMIEYCELHNLDINVASSIGAVCRRIRNYYKTFIFRYKGDPITNDDKVRLQKSLNTKSYRHFYILTLDGDIYKEYNSIMDAERDNFATETRICEALNHPDRNNSINGYLVVEKLEDYQIAISRYLAHKQRKSEGHWICQYDLNGKYLTRYDSTYTAATALGIKSVTSIKACLQGKQRKAYDSQWKYSDTKDDIEPYEYKYNSENCYKPVYQYDLKGNLIKKFKSAKEAAEELNGNYKFIRSCAAGYKKSAYGYIWKYE